MKQVPIAFCVISRFEDLETIDQLFPDFFSLGSKIISCEKAIYLIYSNFFVDATPTVRFQVREQNDFMLT